MAWCCAGAFSVFRLARRIAFLLSPDQEHLPKNIRWLEVFLALPGYGTVQEICSEITGGTSGKKLG